MFTHPGSVRGEVGDELDTEALGTVDRILLVEQTAQVIRRAIFDGLLRPGQKLNEARLAQELGMSRGPVREALRLLREHGLVRSEPYRGTFVAEFALPDVVEVLTLREALEPLAAGAAMARPDSELLPALEDALGAMRASADAGDAERVADTHVVFHGVFYAHADHRLLRVLWERLEVPLRLYVMVHQMSFGPATDIAAQHDEMLRLARAGDVAGLQAEIRQHLASNMEHVLANLSGPEADRARALLSRFALAAFRLNGASSTDGEGDGAARR